MISLPPVIAIDGPTASGKGTIAQHVADQLKYHYLDSGALYRLVALKAGQQGVRPDEIDRLRTLAATLSPKFEKGAIWLDGVGVTDAIRAEDVGRVASQIAVHASVRRALLDLQQQFRRPPGLVADGRDMGSVVFPDAALKVFLTADVEARAKRRYKQLIDKGFPANIADLLQDLRARDQRDSERTAAPLKPAEDAYQLDSSSLTVEEVVAQVLNWYAKLAPLRT